jgi:hypothetical protein
MDSQMNLHEKLNGQNIKDSFLFWFFLCDCLTDSPIGRKFEMFSQLFFVEAFRIVKQLSHSIAESIQV